MQQWQLPKLRVIGEKKQRVTGGGGGRYLHTSVCVVGC